MRSDKERVTGGCVPQCVDEECSCNSPCDSTSSDPKTPLVSCSKGFSLVALQDHATDKDPSDFPQAPDVCHGAFLPRDFPEGAEPMETSDDDTATNSEAFHRGAAKPTDAAAATSAAVLNVGSHASEVHDYARGSAVLQSPGHIDAPAAAIVATGQPLVSVKRKDGTVCSSVNHRQLIYFCSSKRLRMPAFVSKHHARQAVTVVMSIARYMKHYYNQSQLPPPALLSDRIKAEPRLRDKVQASRSCLNLAMEAAAAPECATTSVATTTAAITVARAAAVDTAPVAVPATVVAAPTTDAPAASSGRPRRKTRIQYRFEMDSDWELDGSTAPQSSEDEDIGSNKVVTAAAPVAVGSVTTTTGTPKRLYSLLNGNGGAPTVALQQESFGGNAGVIMAPSGNGTPATVAQLLPLIVSVTSSSSTSRQVRPSESLRPVLPQQANASQQQSAGLERQVVSMVGTPRPASSSGKLKPSAAAGMPKSAIQVGAPQPTLKALTPKLTSMALTPKPTAMATPKSTSLAVAVIPNPTSVAITPKTTSVAITPKLMSVAVTAKLTSVAVTPKPTSVAITPKPTSVAIAPKPTSVAIAPKPTAVAIIPKPTSVAVTPKPTSTAVSPKATSMANPKPNSKALSLTLAQAAEMPKPACLEGTPKLAPAAASPTLARAIASSKPDKIVEASKTAHQVEAPIRAPSSRCMADPNRVPPDGTNVDTSGYKCLLVVYEKNAPAEVLGKKKHVLIKKGNNLHLNPLAPSSSSLVVPAGRVASTAAASGGRHTSSAGTGCGKLPSGIYSGPTFLMGRSGAHLANLFPVTVQIKQALEKGKLNIAPDSAVTIGLDGNMRVIMPSASASANGGVNGGSSARSISRDSEAGRSSVCGATTSKLVATKESGRAAADSHDDGKWSDEDDTWLPPPSKKGRLAPDPHDQVSLSSSRGERGCEGDGSGSVLASSTGCLPGSCGNGWWIGYSRQRGKRLCGGGWRTLANDHSIMHRSSELFNRCLKQIDAADTVPQFEASRKKMEAMFDALKVIRRTFCQPSSST